MSEDGIVVGAIHNGTKPTDNKYKCKKCPFGTDDRNRMELHRRVHQNKMC